MQSTWGHGARWRRFVATPVLAALAAAAMAGPAAAVEVSSGYHDLVGGGPGGSVWELDDYRWCGYEAGYGMVLDEGELDPASTTPVGEQGDAFDGAYFVTIDGQEFSPPVVEGAPVFDVDATDHPTRLTAGPSAHGDLLATQEFRAYPDRAVMRVMLTLTNPTSAAVETSVRVAGDVGSDSDTQVRATSSGDGTVTDADRWAVTSDEGDDDPVLTHVMYGPGSPAVVPSAFFVGGNACLDHDYVYEDEFAADFDMALAAGQTRRLLWFVTMEQTSADAVARATTFDSASGVRSAFLSDLTASELASVGNWSFPQRTSSPSAPAPNADGDRHPDAGDNCPFVANDDQADHDADGVGDGCQGATAARVAAGEPLSDGDGEATTERPVHTTVTAPTTGPTSIRWSPTLPSADGSVVQLPHEVEIHTSDQHARPDEPVVIEFRLDDTALPTGVAPSQVGVVRNGTPVAVCTGADGVAEPDPCIAGATSDGDDTVVTVLTSRASTWAFTVPDPCVAGAPSAFADVTGTIHEDGVACITAWGLTTGVTADAYAPYRDVTRGQMATFLHRTVLAMGGELPDGRDRYQDDDASTHETAINALAAAGIVRGMAPGTFAPSEPITRATMAAFTMAALEHVTGTAVVAADDHFPDDDGHTSEAAINAATEAGIARGRVDGTFDPEAPVQRGQAGSFLARLVERVLNNA